MAKLTSVGPVSDEDTNALPVKNFADAIAFYENVLGFSMVNRDSSSAVLRRDEVQIGLLRKPDHEPGQAGSIAFAVDDLEAMWGEIQERGGHTHDVAQKQPNQLGIFDMSGNVWEWCQDTFTPDVLQIPDDGSAFVGQVEERVLRGGCFHNWAMHCTVFKRYKIGHQFHDGCIGFRLVFSSLSSR